VNYIKALKPTFDVETGTSRPPPWPGLLTQTKTPFWKSYIFTVESSWSQSWGRWIEGPGWTLRHDSCWWRICWMHVWSSWMSFRFGLIALTASISCMASANLESIHLTIARSSSTVDRRPPVSRQARSKSCSASSKFPSKSLIHPRILTSHNQVRDWY